MRRLVCAVAAGVAVLAAGSAAATSASPQSVKLATPGEKIAHFSADGPHAVFLLRKREGRKTCASVSLWTPGGHVHRVPRRACVWSDTRGSNFEALTLAGTRAVWVNYTYGNFAYCEGPFTSTLHRLTPTHVANTVCDGSDNYFWDFKGDRHLLVGRAYHYCDSDCANYGPAYEEYVTLYRFSGGHFLTIASLPHDTRLLGVDAGRILLQGPSMLEIVDTHGASLATVQLTAHPDAAFLSGGDLVAAVGGSLLDYDASTGTLLQTWPMRAGGRLRGLEAGRALYVTGKQLHLLRLSDGRDRVVATVPHLAGEALTESGLYYAANVAGDGTVTFVPAARLPS